MLVRIRYKESPYFRITNISVIGSFNNYEAEQGIMQREAGGWFIDVSLNPGNYIYKFLINGEVQLTDPLSNIYETDNAGNVWSVIIIDDEDQRLYDNNQYELTLDEYLLSGKIVAVEEQTAVSKKQFNLSLDEKIVARFGFPNVTGLHEVTLFWFMPDGTLYSYAQNSLFQEYEKTPIYLWFWISLYEIKVEGFEGVWTIKLFVDGNYVLEDQMTINSGVIYQRYGSYYDIKA